MADHFLVEQVLSWLGNWDENNAPKPILIDRDDAESDSWQGRQVTYDLTEQHAAGVSSSPDRITSPIGTEYDHKVEDAVSVRLEGAHTDEWGTISDAGQWQSIVGEAKRVILTERTSYPTVNGVDYHTVLLGDESNLSVEHKSYFRTDFDVIFRGFEDV